MQPVNLDTALCAGAVCFIYVKIYLLLLQLVICSLAKHTNS